MKNIFYKQREDFLKTLPERDKKFTFPDDVEEIKNVPYASDGLPTGWIFTVPAGPADKSFP